ncbi:hypothetical protein SAMN04487770_12363 [Butyrivibrio sp. ob235]|uniref:YdbC family protein n=1 Tax=Butyrivibrio sp. ob235 TaxID=1761780 RepID=UPI0008C0F280|nr:hypothetical protein SAMN04487770_12363 [Butyrivibrio sp. ob235]
MRILKDNLSKTMKPYVKKVDGVLCIKRGKVDDAISAITTTYGAEGCASVETNAYGREYLIVYAADKNRLRKVQEYYIGVGTTDNKSPSKKTKDTIEAVVADSKKEILTKETSVFKGENYEIIKHIGIISEAPSGWKKELNLVSWHGKEPKYDIREWSPTHEKMGKGVTFSKDELLKLNDIINVIDSSD